MSDRHHGIASGIRTSWIALAVLTMVCALLLGLSTSTNYKTGCDWLALDGGVAYGDDHTVVDLLTVTGLEGGLQGSANYSVDAVGCLEAQITSSVTSDVWNIYR